MKRHFLAAIRRLRARPAAQSPLPAAMAALNPNAAAAVRQALVDTEALDIVDKRVAVDPVSPSAADMSWDGPQLPVDPASARPGDIAVFADRTAIVANNGQLIGPAGLQQPTGTGFQGIFRPA